MNSKLEERPLPILVKRYGRRSKGVMGYTWCVMWKSMVVVAKFLSNDVSTLSTYCRNMAEAARE